MRSRGKSKSGFFPLKYFSISVMSLFLIVSSAIEDSAKRCFDNGFFLLDGNVIEDTPFLLVEILILPNFVDMVKKGIIK